MNNKADQKRARMVVCSLLMFFVMLTLAPRLKSVWELSARKDRLQVQQQQALETNRQLTAQKDKLNNMENIERIAREQLGMVKKGEKVLVEVAPDSAKTP